jgi:hypothetical protein
MKKVLIPLFIGLLVGVLIGTFAVPNGSVTGNVVEDLPEEQASTTTTTIPYSEVIGSERKSPSNRVEAEDLVLYRNQVRIYMDDLHIAQFNDTNSMDPFIDEDAHAIQKDVTSKDDVFIGDIVAYEDSDGFLVLHRIVDISEDSEGWYAIFKGDNNAFVDYDKVRFEQLKYIVVGIFY